MRLAIPVVTALCTFIGAAQGTTIVAVRTQTTIVLGADGKAIAEDWGGIRTEARGVCKIGVAKDVVWGESGILEVRTRNFSVDQIAAASMSMVGDLDVRIKTFENAMLPKLTEILSASKTNSPAWFHVRFENQPAVGIVFAAFVDGVPNLRSRDFIARSDQISGAVSVAIKPHDSPSAAFPNSASHVSARLGRHVLADDEIKKNPLIWDRLGLPGAVRHLIEMEIAAVPDEVGPPIAIIEITNAGRRWISRGQCAPE